MSTELVERAKAGDPDAFAQIYREHRTLVFAVTYSRVRNRELAEDLTQDVFLRAMRSIGTWRDQGKDIGAWLKVIAANMCRDHFRATRRRPATEELPDWVAGIADTDPAADVAAAAVATADRAGLQRMVRELLAPLSPVHRKVLQDRYLRGLTSAEIARRTGVPVGTVKSRVHVATAQLRGAA